MLVSRRLSLAGRMAGGIFSIILLLSAVLQFVLVRAFSEFLAECQRRLVEQCLLIFYVTLIGKQFC